MAEKHLKLHLYRILRSCKSKDQISDVVSTTKIPLLSPEGQVSGRKCPPSSPDFPMQKKKKKKKKSKVRFMYKKRERFPDCNYVVNGLFSNSSSSSSSSDDEEEEVQVEAQAQAVVKRSSDPYSDFRSSMVEMIVENNIFSANDLENLLRSFLSLNSYHHHNLIIQVFAEIWEAFFFSNLN